MSKSEIAEENTGFKGTSSPTTHNISSKSDKLTKLSTNMAKMESKEDSVSGSAQCVGPLGGGQVMDEDLEGIPDFIVKLMEDQPTMNLMTIGDVSHGKSTLMEALSKEKTAKFGEEKRKNMTIKLGYTSCKIFKCLLCPAPECYFPSPSRVMTMDAHCPNCDSRGEDGRIILVRHLSFVDCPGHASLMGTMISAACVADGALMVVDSSRKCPGPQTVQHMQAAYMLGVLTHAYSSHNEMEEKSTPYKPKLVKSKKLIVAQNKIDLINPSKACLNYFAIRQFISEYDTELAFNTSIMPISAQSQLNIDALCMRIVQEFAPHSMRLTQNCSQNPSKNGTLRVNIIRSFDVNKGKVMRTLDDIDGLQGGVIGGVIKEGMIEVGQNIEIRPGLIQVFPIESQVVSIHCGTKQLQRAYSGANVGIQLNIDPYLTKGDRMVGHVLMNEGCGERPFVFQKCIVSYTHLEGFQKCPFNAKETVRINIGSFKANGRVTNPKMRVGASKMKAIVIELSSPLCANTGDLVAITRKIKKKWVLAAGGVLQRIKPLPLLSVAERQKDIISVSRG